MKKIKLNLDDLKVESFHTTPETGKGREGTVFGFADEGDFIKSMLITACTCYSCPIPC